MVKVVRTKSVVSFPKFFVKFPHSTNVVATSSNKFVKLTCCLKPHLIVQEVQNRMKINQRMETQCQIEKPHLSADTVIHPKRDNMFIHTFIDTYSQTNNWSHVPGCQPIQPNFACI